jgi:hypothetical protein
MVSSSSSRSRKNLIVAMQVASIIAALDKEERRAPQNPAQYELKND